MLCKGQAHVVESGEGLLREPGSPLAGVTEYGLTAGAREWTPISSAPHWGFDVSQLGQGSGLRGGPL